MFFGLIFGVQKGWWCIGHVNTSHSRGATPWDSDVQKQLVRPSHAARMLRYFVPHDVVCRRRLMLVSFPPTAPSRIVKQCLLVSGCAPQGSGSQG